VNRNVFLLLGAQFVTAFADNAMYFAAVAMILQDPDLPGWYMPTLQASFLLAFVVLAAWVGPYSDTRPKKQVLISANLVKAVGAVLAFMQVEPLLAFAVVGIGAAIYGPAKYGILPELVPEALLVKTNGWLEGSTILAIITGSLVGSAIADDSVPAALSLVVVLYGVSGAMAFWIVRTPPATLAQRGMLRLFWAMVRELTTSKRGRYAALGVSLFWGAAAVLRIALVAWAPAVLLVTKSSDIAELTLFSAIGVALGAVFVPTMIPLHRLYRTRVAAYLMGLAIIVVSVVDHIWTARLLLMTAGIAGGLFVVPLNAALQNLGYKSHGAGSAVAIQHFFENSAMLASTGVYALAVGQGASPVLSLMILGVAVVAATLLLERLPLEPSAGSGS
jgi:LPLT family lysophospholipid transporter-like MFS transporter